MKLYPKKSGEILVKLEAEIERNKHTIRTAPDTPRGRAATTIAKNNLSDLARRYVAQKRKSQPSRKRVN